MVITLLTALLLAPSHPAVQDTLVALQQGDRVILSGFSGAISVETWNREGMDVWSDAGEDARIRVVRSGSRLELRVEDEKGRNRDVELRLTVPAWLGLEVSGRDLEVEVHGLEGEVHIRNLDGDIVLSDLSGPVEAVSVQGGIQARELNGPARLKTGNDDIEVHGATGDLWIETIAGELDLKDLSSRRLEVSTTSGDVDFQGRLQPSGEYTFQSHDGDITLILSEPVDQEVSVLVYDGEFTSSFPVRARGIRSGEDFSFKLGDGSGRLRLQTFDGDIRILRGG
jgi:DUF4097 and DUF4098 domain-containing protein YvlB